MDQARDVYCTCTIHKGRLVNSALPVYWAFDLLCAAACVPTCMCVCARARVHACLCCLAGLIMNCFTFFWCKFFAYRVLNAAQRFS